MKVDNNDVVLLIPNSFEGNFASIPFKLKYPNASYYIVDGEVPDIQNYKTVYIVGVCFDMDIMNMMGISNENVIWIDNRLEFIKRYHQLDHSVYFSAILVEGKPLIEILWDYLVPEIEKPYYVPFMSREMYNELVVEDSATQLVKSLIAYILWQESLRKS